MKNFPYKINFPYFQDHSIIIAKKILRALEYIVKLYNTRKQWVFPQHSRALNVKINIRIIIGIQKINTLLINNITFYHEKFILYNSHYFHWTYIDISKNKKKTANKSVFRKPKSKRLKRPKSKPNTLKLNRAEISLVNSTVSSKLFPAVLWIPLKKLSKRDSLQSKYTRISMKIIHLINFRG